MISFSTLWLASQKIILYQRTDSKFAKWRGSLDSLTKYLNKLFDQALKMIGLYDLKNQHKYIGCLKGDETFYIMGKSSTDLK